MILTRRAVVALLVVLPVAASVGQDEVQSPVDVCGGGGDHALIQGQVFESGDDSYCNGKASITLGPAVTFQTGSTTMLEAPVIEVHEDVDALLDATLEFRHRVVTRVPKTGQATCYDEDGLSIGCAGSGQDGELQKGAAWPVPRFVINGNGTVTDNVTGLIWMRDPSCLDDYKYPNTLWTDALGDAATIASGQCGLSDGSNPGQWRIPNIRELVSLMHFGIAPALPNTAGTGPWQDEDPFTGVYGAFDGASSYWTSTTWIGRVVKDFAWDVSLYHGRPNTRDKDNFGFVWMVRGRSPFAAPAPLPVTGQVGCYDNDGNVVSCAGTGQDADPQEGVDWPVPRFTDNLNGTVTDNLTTLVWLKDADCWATRATWETALSRVNSLAAPTCGLTDGSTAGDWRLPNSLEFMSLMHYGYANRSLPDTTGTGQWSYGDPFYDVVDLAYWTSTTPIGAPDNAWYVEFKYGRPGFRVKDALANVWAVRDGD